LVEKEELEVMIQSLYLKVEKLMGLIKSATVVASKAVIEEQPAKECSKLTAKVKALKKKKEEVHGLLMDLLDNSREIQHPGVGYEMALDRQSFWWCSNTSISTWQTTIHTQTLCPRTYPSMEKVSKRILKTLCLVLRKF
jgi:ssDNA-binding Zn-finger/Zn-ribbon topoisomerase 1